jgi:flagellar biosynthetic protein FliO
MEFLQQLASVATVIALLAATLWWLKRRGMAGVLRRRRGNSRRLQTVERLPLGPHHTLHLVRMGGRFWIVGCSPGGCTLLAEHAWHEMAAPDATLRGETCGG